jgi:aspartokinase/homoserine dehydrogenase 1
LEDIEDILWDLDQALAMSGVTDLLLQSASLAAQGKLDSLAEAESTLRQKHFSALDSLVKDETLREQTKIEINSLILALIDLCNAIAVIGEASPRALDAVASLGERMSVRLLAAVANEAGIKAEWIESAEFVVTNAHFQNANPDFRVTTEKTRAALNPILDAGIVPITTGFIGATPDGIVTTLGRGGSDYSAAIIGKALPADEVWIWTDVDGVMTTDPRIVKEAQTLAEISYGEIAELAYYGAKVLHPKTIRPVVEAGIGLRICNTFNPTHAGTRLTSNGKKNGRVIKAVTAIRKQRLVTIEGRGMLGVPGVAARAFGAVASHWHERAVDHASLVGAIHLFLLCLPKPRRRLSRRSKGRLRARSKTMTLTVSGLPMRFPSSPSSARECSIRPAWRDRCSADSARRTSTCSPSRKARRKFRSVSSLTRAIRNMP